MKHDHGVGVFGDRIANVGPSTSARFFVGFVHVVLYCTVLIVLRIINGKFFSVKR